MNGRKDAIVVGAGIIGICCARYLQREGFSVTVVTRDPPGEACSAGNSGGFGVSLIAPVATPGILTRVPSLWLDPRKPLAIEVSLLPRLLPWFARFVATSTPARYRAASRARASLCERVFEALDPLLQDAGAESLVRPGGMMFIYDSEESLAAARPVHDVARTHGVPLLELDADAVRNREPALGARARCGVVSPTTRHTTNPRRLVQMLARGLPPSRWPGGRGGGARDRRRRAAAGRADRRDDRRAHTIPLGFMFPMPDGTLVSSVDATSHGQIIPVGQGLDFSNTTGELLTDVGLYPYWNDLGFGGFTDPTADIYVTTGPTSATIRYANYNDSAPGPTFSFQVILHSDGTFEFQYDSRAEASPFSDVHIGFSDGMSVDPGESDLSSTLALPIDTGTSATAYELFDVVGGDVVDIQDFSVTMFPNGSGGYIVVGSTCTPLVGVATTGSPCDYGPPGSGPVAISWFQNGTGGYTAAFDSGIPFDSVNTGTSIGAFLDTVTNVTLGFSFTMPGGLSVTDLDVDNHGRVFSAGAALSEFTPTVTELLTIPGPSINAFWTDLDPEAGGADILFWTDGVSRANLTWMNVEQTFVVPSNRVTFQLQLDAGDPLNMADDSFTVVYEDVASVNTGPDPTLPFDILIGCSEGNAAVDPGESDLSATPDSGLSPTLYEFIDAFAGMETQDLQATAGTPILYGLVANSSPIIGGTLDLELQNVPNGPVSASILAFGFTDLNVPFSLVSPMNPCILNSSANLFSLDVISAPVFNASISLAGFDPAFAGTTIVAQGISVDADLPWFAADPNELPFATSNGLLITFTP